MNLTRNPFGLLWGLGRGLWHVQKQAIVGKKINRKHLKDEDAKKAAEKAEEERLAAEAAMVPRIPKGFSWWRPKYTPPPTLIVRETVISLVTATVDGRVSLWEWNMKVKEVGWVSLLYPQSHTLS